jgi:hypothetical protein
LDVKLKLAKTPETQSAHRLPPGYSAYGSVSRLYRDIEADPINFTLNSDAITIAYGNYGIEVLSQTQQQRLVSLFSITGGTKICRTLAVTHFLPLDPALSEVDRLIRDGLSVGAALREARFGVHKVALIQTTVSSGPAFFKLSNKETPIGTQIRTQVYALSAIHKDKHLPYAIIAEAYHPDHQPQEHPMAGVTCPHHSAALEVLSSLRTAMLHFQLTSE